MSDIWKIGQENSADRVYRQMKSLGIGKCEQFAVARLTDMCEQMITEFDTVLQDKNEYILELEDYNLEVENANDDLQAKINKLLEEIEALRAKEQNGTITEEEKEELAAKNAELDGLYSQNNSVVETKGNELQTKGETLSADCKSKEKIATEYAETTIEKGQPLADTVVQRASFWRKLTGKTKRQKAKKELGENAVKTGNALLEQVQISTELDPAMKFKKS